MYNNVNKTHENCRKIEYFVKKFCINLLKNLLTDKLEIVILELKKFNKYIDKVKNQDLISWVKFLESPGEIDMKTEKNEYVKEAVNELEELSKDEQEQRIADLREKYILDRNTLFNGGYREGVAEGEKRGLEKGKKERN